MDVISVLFFLFALVTVFAATRVITARNPVHSALFLVLTFVSSAAIWLLMKAEFLALLPVLGYGGAGVVLRVGTGSRSADDSSIDYVEPIYNNQQEAGGENEVDEFDVVSPAELPQRNEN